MSRSSLKRKPGKRAPKERISIFTEGEVTEVEYLRDVCNRFGLPKELVAIRKSQCTDAKGIVDETVAEKNANEAAAKRGREARVEQWWAVVDTECRPLELNDAIQKAKSNKILLAISDPSFEFWLRLHFGYTTSPYNSVDRLIRELRDTNRLPTYCDSNKHPDMNVLFPLIAEAVNNARNLRRNHTRIGNSQPCTDCDLLINSIALQSRVDVTAFEVTVNDFRNLSMYATQ